MFVETESASLETIYRLKDTGVHAPASTTLHANFISLVKPGDLFLDIGCAHGRVTHQLDILGARAVAFDPNLQELLTGKAEFPELSFLQAYGEYQPFPPDTFDGAVMLGVLGAVNRNQREEILNETMRVLKDGGLIYVAEFALINDPFQRTHYDNRRWVDVYTRDSNVIGEYGSVVVHNTRDGGIWFIAHHFRSDELSDLLQHSGVKIMASKNVTVESQVSGQLRDTFNIWGLKVKS
ncbi:MAG: class I SAM-dependent methyltransferase [Candidatus Daviesbacteria bacterium]|nr:class I SAM-dependent methyltransferase [Candidatus Daviesbacteria bacterium]